MEENGNERRGQVVLLFGLFIPFFVVATGLLVDMGSVSLSRHRLQDAVNVAALSAATQIGQDKSVIETALESLADEGLTRSQIEVNYPFNSDPYKVEVQVEKNVALYFSPVLGVNIRLIQVRAVAAAGTGVSSNANLVHVN